MAGKEEQEKQEERERTPVRRGSKSIWPWKKESDTSASFLRAARAGNLEKVLEFLKASTDINTCNANGLNALHLASKEGHVHVVQALLERNASVDAATKKGNTALHIASLAGQEEIVKVLLDNSATVNMKSQNGFTPLYMAAQENHDSVVRLLLSRGANQSLATEDGFTPLAVALQQGHDKVVAVLLENDTRGKVRLPALHIAAKKDDTKVAALLLHTDHNPDVTSKSGFTPLHIAAHYGNENVASLLIQRGADVNYAAKHQITPLHVASKWGKGNMVSLLLEKGANIDAKTRDGLTPLHCAARSGHETVVDMLLEKGAPITAKTKNGLAPLHMASQGDHVDAARILLYHKAPVDDVTVDFLTALHVAAHCGHVRVAKLLLDRKADPNSRALNGFTPLHIACKKNRIKVVELLLKHGASIEATTESGLTPLHVASFMGCMNILIYLLQHGATPDVPTVRGETPLHLAARANQTDIIRILVRNGAQVDARAREQQTALHIASRLGNSDIVMLLLQHGADVNATTKDHYTPLHIAAKEGQEEVASILLEHGASLTAATKKGFTPLHLAAKYGNIKVARLLLQKDAPVDAQGKNGVTPLHVASHYDHQNVALLLLDKGASPHATAKNGYTPLHIAARKNQMDIATTLLEYGASANAESKAGFTPLHLSAQEGHTDMSTLLIEHKASSNGAAKNGLTPLHLCAQEDRVNVAAILVKNGSEVDPTTKAGYTPLHVASHFGQMNMVRFLLQHSSKVDACTQLGYTPLHQAAQQGHTQVVNLLLENKAEPNTETKDGKTALSIAQRLGYISVVETLKIVTETKITTNTTTVTEDKYKVVVPETMHETFMSESEDEGGDDTMLGDHTYKYLTVDEMKSLGDDSLPIDVTKDEKLDVSFQGAVPPQAVHDQTSPALRRDHVTLLPADNIEVSRPPVMAGTESLNAILALEEVSVEVRQGIEGGSPRQGGTTQALVNTIPVQGTPLATAVVPGHGTEVLTGWEEFLVSFMVDARGGAMRGCRHSGVRVIIPPRKASAPMRITCRYLKKDKLVHAPPLMEGEALASRILEMGPAAAKFLGPVILEVPHFASLRGKEREIVILRSDNGETWREHTLEATEEAVQEVLNESFDGEELKQLEDLNTDRITRILTTDFPQYFAIVTRIRQEVHAIGPEGGMVSSTVVPQVQAVFPQGALTKKIKVGLQAQPIPPDLVAKLLGNRVAVSPIVTIEPRRRKFHKPITLTIPVPQAASKGMINQYSGEAPTLRLLCSITGGTTRAQWEDVTGSTPLTFVNDCVSFTTTVSARFWLMDCSNIPEATKMATELYREAIHVPFMAKFVVFSKRHQVEEARMRVFCMTDDREDKTLESQENFVEVAKSRDVEVLEGKSQHLEFAGNLVPVTKSGDQLSFNFYAFRENRLPFTVRIKDPHADPVCRIAFMRQPKVGRGDPPQIPICNLNIALPDNILPEPAPSEPDLLSLEKKYSFLTISKADTIHKGDLLLSDISNMLTTDWVSLAKQLDVMDSDINTIKSQYPDNAAQQAIVMLQLWMHTAGNKATGNLLEKALHAIGREDIVHQCIISAEPVPDATEKVLAQSQLDHTISEQGSGRSLSVNRDASMDVSYDEHEQDIMKDAESAEEEEDNQKLYQEQMGKEQLPTKPALSPTYEREEMKYVAEEKVVTEESISDMHKRMHIVEKDGETFADYSSSAQKDTRKKEMMEKEEKEIGDGYKYEHIEKFTKEELKQQLIKEEHKEQSVKEKMEETFINKEQLDSSKFYQETIPKKLGKLSAEPASGTGDVCVTRVEEYTMEEAAVKAAAAEKEVVHPLDKSDMLEKLGEELGKLDEKLEEKFRETVTRGKEEVEGGEESEELMALIPARSSEDMESVHPTSEHDSYAVSSHDVEEHYLPAATTYTEEELAKDALDTGTPTLKEEQQFLSEVEPCQSDSLVNVADESSATEVDVLISADETPSVPLAEHTEDSSVLLDKSTILEQTESLSETDVPASSVVSIPPDEQHATGIVPICQMDEMQATDMAEASVADQHVVEHSPEISETDLHEDTSDHIQELEEEETEVIEEGMYHAVKEHTCKSTVTDTVEKDDSSKKILADSHTAIASQADSEFSPLDTRTFSTDGTETVFSECDVKVSPKDADEKDTGPLEEESPKELQKMEISKDDTEFTISEYEKDDLLIDPQCEMPALETNNADAKDDTGKQDGSAEVDTSDQDASEEQFEHMNVLLATQVVVETALPFTDIDVPSTEDVLDEEPDLESFVIQPGQPGYISDDMKDDTALLDAKSGVLHTFPENIESLLECTETNITTEMSADIHDTQVEEKQAAEAIPLTPQREILEKQGIQPETWEFSEHTTQETECLDSTADEPVVKTMEADTEDDHLNTGAVPDGLTQTSVKSAQMSVVSSQEEAASAEVVTISAAEQKGPAQLGQAVYLYCPPRTFSSFFYQGFFHRGKGREVLHTDGVAEQEITKDSKQEADCTTDAGSVEPLRVPSDGEEEQMMLMRDSPHWEEEEIQAEDNEEPQAIKAEIRLLVKTTEIGKESIEIRSIREYVDAGGRKMDDQNSQSEAFESQGTPFTVDGACVPTQQQLNKHPPVPKFVRPLGDQHPLLEKCSADEFDLMAQVRDVMASSEDNQRAVQEAKPGESSQQKMKK